MNVKGMRLSLKQNGVLAWSYQREIVGALLAALLMFCLLACLSYNGADNSLLHYISGHVQVNNWCGSVGAHVAALFFYAFGLCAYVALVFLALLAARLLQGAQLSREGVRVLASIFSLVVSCAVVSHIALSFQYQWSGGFIGNSLMQVLHPIFGYGGCSVLLLCAVWTSACVLLRYPLMPSLLALFETIYVGLCMVASSLVFAVLSVWRAAVWVTGQCLQLWVWPLQVHLNNDELRAFSAQHQAAVKIDDDQESRAAMFDFFGSTQQAPASRQSFQEQPCYDEQSEQSGERFAQKTCYNTGHEYRLLGTTITMLPNTRIACNLFAPLLMLEGKSVVQRLQYLLRVAGSIVTELPHLSLLAQNDSDKAHEVMHEATNRAQKLEEKLAYFGVKGKVSAIKPGPLITLFEYEPEIDSKISRITALEDDLAMALSASSIRTIAPILGKNAVGFEIANYVREQVFVSEIFSTPEFANAREEMALPLALGVDVVGGPVIEDLVSMPHLLIGGATGAGKSVGLHVILNSMLFTRSPQELRLVLIDPKRLEFSLYADIPHLLFPIVTHPSRATQTLKWIVQEMELRYQTMAECGVRNMLEYQALSAKSPQTYSPMHYIVVVIDELADLMMVAGKEVEILIARIAQMARASGIHMIVATQRPSVDVVTGIIKVNFPSRIAFRVSSKVDSRVIIDGQGAEKLLGRGDMLYMHPSTSGIKRVHGAYISEKEIESVNNFWKEQQSVQYLNLHEVLKADESAASSGECDEIYEQVLEFIKSQDEISISRLQRQFGIGFNRSARIIEQLEADGIIAPSQGGKPRKVIR
ncbi:MAG: DNA translocase FtsK [Epsilonproteobacteria bacterium]|nr:DNA translocase FtsK [Campylobacterota bacterium]